VMPKWKMEYVPKERHLTEREFEKVLEKMPKARKLWLVVAVYTGANLGELTRLEWQHIDLKTNQIRLPGTKARDRYRRVPLAAPLRPWVADASKRRGLMFARWTNVRGDLAAIADAARIPKFTPNDLRRTYASWLVQAGVPHLTVAHLMGHSSTRMVERVYGRLTPAIYTAAVANLPSCAAFVPVTGTKPGLPGTGGTRRPAQKAAKS
jgi:integrase